jgi:predicted phage tail component-like protein
MTTWTFGGTALTSFGKVTLINDYLDSAERRGDNQVIAFRDGENFVQKYYNGRKLTFGIAITAASATALETTFDTMRALFAIRTQQSLAQTREDSTVRTSLATVDGTISPERITNTLARVTVSFVLTSPYFRLSTLIADNTTTIDATPKAMVVTNTGTVEERDATIILTGPLQNTVITNSTNGCTLTYTGTIASPRVVTISTVNGQYVATNDLGTNVIGNITHSGSPALMVFNAGANTLSIADATHTTGTVKVSFYPPFL